MRANYSEEESYPGEFELWQANCTRSRQGRKGGEGLRRLEAALLALPSRKLHNDVFVKTNGECCAIGALAVQEEIGRGSTREEAITNCATGDATKVEEIGVKLGMPRLVAWAVAVENDQYEGRMVAAPELPRGTCFRQETPAERYERVVGWVQQELRGLPQNLWVEG